MFQILRIHFVNIFQIKSEDLDQKTFLFIFLITLNDFRLNHYTLIAHFFFFGGDVTFKDSNGRSNEQNIKTMRQLWRILM